MAIIYTYPEINQVEGEDLLLISDTSLHKRPTRSVTIDNLAAYIGTVVGVVQNLQSVLTVGNTYVSPDGYGTFTLNDITNNDGQIKYLNTDEGWGYFLNAEEGLFFTDGTGSQTGSTSIGLGYVSIGNSNHIGEIRSANITANRTYQLPNASGTIALTSDIPTPGPSGSGTTNYTARWTSASALGIGALYDNGTSVGIGINGTYANPPQRLTVVSDDSIQPVAQFKNIGTGGGLFVRTDGTTRPLFELFSGSSYRVVVTGSGNLGIGTTSPSQKLEVAGNVKLDGDNRHIFFGGNNTFIGEKSNSTELELRGGGNSTAQTVYIDNTGQIGVGTSNPSQKLEVLGNSLVTGTQFIGDTFTKIQQASGNLLLTNQSSSGAIRFLTNSTERVRIDSSGNVGIGTTSPSQKLEVIGNVKVSSTIYSPNLATWGNVPMTIRSDDYIRFLTSSSNNERMRILNNGNIGIGTTSPSDKLEVYGGNLIVNDGTSKSRLRPSDLYMQQAGVIKAWLRADGNSYLNGGNLGIGTTSPAYILDVVSAGAATARLKSAGTGAISLRYENGSGFKSAAVVDNSGLYRLDATNISLNPTNNVGIGTTSPAAKLHLSESASGGNPSFILQDNARSGAAALNYILLTDSLNTNQAKIGYLSGLNTELTLQNLVGNTSLISSGQTKIISGTNTLFENSGSERMRITSDGKVGIGTTNPLAKLQVSSTSGWGVFTERGIKDGSTSTYSHSFGAGNAHVLGRSTIFESTVTFSTLTADAQTKEYRLQNSSNKLVLASVVAGITTEDNILVASGANIGIGTNSPGAKLDVNGTTYLRSVALDTIFGYSGNNIAFTNTGNTTFNNSNVGIGTTNPQGKLDISTTTSSDIFNLRIHNLTGEVSQSTGILFNTGYTDVSRGKGGLVYEYDTSAGWNRGDFHFLQRQDGASGVARLSDSVLTIKNNGNVGIGTTSPGEKLEVSGNVLAGGGSLNKTIGFKRTDGFNLDLAKIIANGEIRIGGTNVGVITFNRSSNEVMRIASNNNVGIGTTSPDYALHVDPTVKIGDRQGTDGSLILQSQQGPNITFTSSGDALNISGSTGSSNGNFIRLQDDIKVFEFMPNIGGTIRINRGNRGLMNTNIGGYAVQDQTTTASNGRSTFLSTDSGGTILRSTSYGSIGTSGDIQFQFGGGSNTSEPAPATKMIIKNDGNVGIGTTAPSEKLHVFGGAAAIEIDSTTNEASLKYDNSTTTANIKLANNDLKTELGGAERMRILANGNVGIGTTAPSTKLHVNGDIRIQGENELYFGGTGSVPHWEITASGSDLIVNDTGTNVGSVLFNNDEGVALPRLTTTEINAISSPAQGLMAYNTTLNTICFYNGSSWQKVSHTSM